MTNKTEMMSLELVAAVEPLLSGEDLYWLRDFIENKESGVAYETLVDLLANRQLTLAADVKEKFVALAIDLGIESKPNVSDFLKSLG